jgi:hypothetical protein
MKNINWKTLIIAVLSAIFGSIAYVEVKDYESQIGYGSAIDVDAFSYDECKPGEKCNTFMLVVTYARDRVVDIEKIAAPGLPTYEDQKGWTEEYWTGVHRVSIQGQAKTLNAAWVNKHLLPPLPRKYQPDASRAITVWVVDSAGRWIQPSPEEAPGDVEEVAPDAPEI